jgi:hypothetical protein
MQIVRIAAPYRRDRATPSSRYPPSPAISWLFVPSFSTSASRASPNRG